VQPLDSVLVESCRDVCSVESCFRDESIKRVCAEGEKGGETTDYGCVRCTCAAHDYEEYIDFYTRPVLANSVSEGVYVSRISCAVWERLWSMQYFHSPN
jgi:hypothetical protein